MPRLRFVHAADLHLDSPFHGLRSDVPDYVSQMLHRATFVAYENIVDLCIREGVDALLVAGDVYDSADRSLRAQLKFVDGLERLDAAGVRSFICHGNHDPLDGWEARLALPPGCVRFGSEVTAEPIFPGQPDRATVYGLSFPQRDVRQDPSPLFRDAIVSRGLNIGLLHANVGGNPNHGSYSPCSIQDLLDIDIDYWALGHVHTQQVLRKASPAIVYPGNPQGRHPNESGIHGAYLVEIDENGSVRLNFHSMDVVRWQSRECNITEIDNEHQLLDTIDELAHTTLEAANGLSVMFRLTLTGRGPMHRFLRRSGIVDDILEHLNGQFAGARSWLWCGRIQVATTSSVDRERAACREDFVGDLIRLSNEIRESPSALAELRETLRELYIASNASPYLRSLLPSNEELRELIAAAEEECLAALVDDEHQE